MAICKQHVEMILLIEVGFLKNINDRLASFVLDQSSLTILGSFLMIKAHFKMIPTIKAFVGGEKF